MAITNSSSTISVTGGETGANLTTFVGNNASSGTAAGAYFRFAWPLVVNASATMTAVAGTEYLFEGSSELRLDAAGILNMGTGSSIRFTGASKNHTQVNGTLIATNFNYTIDTQTNGGSGRNDPFSSAAQMQGKNWTITLRGGLDAFVHLHGITGVDGVTLQNNKTSGGTYWEFAGLTYRRISFPQNSGSGSTFFYMPRNGNDRNIQIEPVFRGTGTFQRLRGDGNAECWWVDPRYPDHASTPPLQNTRIGGNAANSAADSLIEYFTLRADALADQTDPIRLRVTKDGTQVFNNTFVAANTYAHPDGYTAYLLEARRVQINTTNNSARSAFAARFRRAGMADVDVASFTPSSATRLTNAPVAYPGFTGTTTAARALTGVSFSDSGTEITVTVTEMRTGQEIFNAFHAWLESNMTVPQTRLAIVNGTLEITGSMTASEAISAGGNVTSIKATGAITTTGSGSFSLPIEDINGVRVTIRKSGGGNFNIAARYGSGSTYTDLGYQADVSTITYTVPKGQPVEVVMWALGYVTYSRLISTVNGGVVFDAEMTLNESINTSLDVSPYLPNIALSLDTSGASTVFVITFNAAMTISGIELGKAVIHRLVGQEIALKAGFPPGSTATIVINSDEITNQLPAARLALGAGLSVTDRVHLDFFINTAPALAINPAYVINPPRADGNQVVILRAKPALDASVMALAVRQEIERTGGMLDVKASQASVTALAAANQAEHDATQAAIAALPAPLTATQTRAQVDAALTAYDAVVPADLATLATAAQVTALGAPLQASNYTAPPSATSTAQAVRAELATELGRMDAAVSSRLASASYTAPTAPPTAAQNATAVRTELATELGRIDASVSSRLATSAYTAPTTPPTAAAIRAEIEATGGKLDKAMKAAQAAEDQTL